MRLLVLILALGMPSAGCFATPASTSEYLARMDADHDGRVSVDEYQQYMSLGFERMDANDDGVVDASERPPSPRNRKPMTLARHQHNLAEVFYRQDIDDDGYLDARELAAPPR